MGQAKARKAEIEQLKSATTTLRVIAIRHRLDGKKEVMSYSDTLTGSDIREYQSVDKNELLNEVCQTVWGHNPPANGVSAYVVQTTTYELTKMMNPYGYVINFHEGDKEYHKPNHQRVPNSCRTMIACRTQSDFDQQLQMICATLETDPDMEIRTYA